ncbi:MAG: hypothetical protein A2350_04610 [Candidatus Raymondbacteria bacterium RifOxyB12_full_50_8]|uniref:Flavodoxin-like domain-containing protein n=1 Tax=Candidatus Raymondbacteria bacterium RIFOXYD12_FULL_49_13 TaxID=1817890 RepID=A0A1F7F6T8_UNCRA|nr:MAG: hypothetical protein A2248_13170 [Candidatus Raymondbacteria bacterium RIFOXYA2_FULL_49_16]OGJ96049.1 MAG: hypothetical protein A2350_04610 [Candidatus Raymondbacteria bacterium RifOxyB12_full_50_8]OGK02237.1 MAG: hypothetical protein A2519_16285 [Candidatus Raymondbacteria bacterium RIFOXYD12_FULL_49_13]OGP45150.1 MAG: hypothetical protein A2324_12185 [Candidatus Raymondbacteria bacterium RIFOXYB2_FULL_49_35]
MGSLLILFHSQEYGNTAAMARAIAEGAAAEGMKAVLVNTNEVRMDIDQYRLFSVAAFGSPDYYSYIAGGLKTFLDDWYIAKKNNARGLTGKKYGLFYSHGGGGDVKGPLETLFSELGDKVGPTIASAGKPSRTVLDACCALGKELARAAQERQ